MGRTTTLAAPALAAALAVTGVQAGHGSPRAHDMQPFITAACADAARPEADTKRDADRHPALSLAFAGVKLATRWSSWFRDRGISRAC